MNNVLQCQALTKSFVDGERRLEVLKGIDMHVASGECVAVVGASGSGKSTLLHLLAGLDVPTAGEVYLAGQAMHQLSERKLCQLRNQQLGFVYQLHHLLPEFSVLENVCMPQLIAGQSKAQAKAAAETLLEQVGLQDRRHHRMAQLSGGERQRTAIARALVNNPACVLADEPTGNLDEKTAEQVIETMLQLNQTLKTSFVVVTHDSKLAKQLDRTLQLVDGKLN